MKEKQVGSGVGDTMKLTWNVGIANDEKRSCSEVKKFPRLLLGLMDMKPAGLIVAPGGD